MLNIFYNLHTVSPCYVSLAILWVCNIKVDRFFPVSLSLCTFVNRVPVSVRCILVSLCRYAIHRVTVGVTLYVSVLQRVCRRCVRPAPRSLYNWRMVLDWAACAPLNTGPSPRGHPTPAPVAHGHHRCSPAHRCQEAGAPRVLTAILTS